MSSRGELVASFVVVCFYNSCQDGKSLQWVGKKKSFLGDKETKEN